MIKRQDYTPTTAGSILHFNALHYPDGIAADFGDCRRTYRELHDRGCKLAAAFEACGVRRRDRVAVLSRNTVEFFEIYAAGWLGGATIATVNYRLAPAEMAFIIEDSAPTLLIFEAHYLETVAALRPSLRSVQRYVCIGASTDWAQDYEQFLSQATRDEPLGRPRPEDPAVLIYTSGTTGRPKGCIHTFGGLGEMARTMAYVQPAPFQDKFLIVMPMFHIGGLGVSLTHFALGGTCLVHREFNVEAVLDTIERERVGITLLAPTMIQMVLDHERCATADLSSLHTLIYSASPMPSNTLRKGLDRFGPIFVQYYGQTEAIHSYLPRHLHRLDGSPEDQARLLSAGLPQPGISLRVVDEQWQDVEAGEPGELLSRSACASIGYWNASAATAETYRDGWIATGDIARMDERGFITIVDRKKDMIISGGENIYSREVEEALVSHTAVAEAAVVGISDPVWGEAVCAIVRVADGQEISEEQLIAHSRSRIASYKKPKSVLFVEQMPKLVSGKIDKMALRRLANEKSGLRG